MRRHAAALLILIAVELFSFGIFSSRIGFYHDDWFFLEKALQAGGGFWSIVKLYSGIGNFLARPVEILHFPLFYVLGGFNPAIYQVLLLVLDILQGVFFFFFLLFLTKNAPFALTASALGMLAPNRSVTHVWWSNTPQNAALACVLAAMVAHQLWLARREKKWLAAGQLLYLASVLNYESGTFFPLALAAGLLVRRRRAGASWRKAALASTRDMLPFAISLAAALAWQWAGIQHILHLHNHKSVSFTFGHVLKAFSAGFECVSNRVLDICSKMAPAALRLGPSYALLAAALAAAAALVMPPPGKDRAFPASLAALGALFVGAYLPYALSGTYVPQIYGTMSRTNGGGAWVTGLGLACAIAALKRPRARQAALAAAVAAFVLADWGATEEWTRAWTLEQDILSQAAPRASALPSGATVLLTGAPSYAGHAIVFDVSWAFAPALRVMTGRGDLEADVATGRLSLGPDAATVAGPDGSRAYPYRNLYLYDYSQNAMLRLTAPPPAK